MKKIIVLLVALLTLSLITVPVLAEDVDTSFSLDVTVTITDNEDGTFTVVIPNDPNYETLTPTMVVYETGLTNVTVLNATTSTYLPDEDVSVDTDGNVSFVVRGGGTFVIDSKKAIVTTAPVANDLTYNGEAQALVTAGVGSNGTMVYSLTEDGTYSDTIPTATNAGNYTVYYYVKGSGANDSVVESVDVTIYKKTFEGTISNPTVGSSITYGQSLSASQLTGEGWVFSNPNFVPVSAGTYNATVEYALNDADNVNYSRVDGYNGAIKKIIRSVSITVDKADPESVTFPTLTATYGDTLADIKLPEGFSFVETDLTMTVGNASETAVEIPMVYTPEDTDNYNTVSGNGLLTVNKKKFDGTIASPTVSSPITYGESVSVAGLSGDGWSFINSDFVPSAGTFEANVSYTLTNTENIDYSDVDGYYGASQKLIRSVTITINKADVENVEFPTLTATYGDTLASITLPEGFSFVETDLTKTVGNASSTPVDIAMIYTPADTRNYNVVKGNAKITISKANPVSVEFPTLTAKYGDKFADVELPSGFTFADSVDTSASVGNASVTPVNVPVVYTPEDTVNYNTVSGVAKLTVDKADPESVTFPTLTATYGDTLASITLPEGFSFVEADLTKTVGNASETAVEIPMVYTPEDTDNYNTVSGNGLLTVNKATYTGTVTVPELDPVESGTKLSDVKLPAGYTWKDAAREVGETNTAIYSPGANYNDVEIEIPVKVVSTESGVNSNEVESVAGVNVTDNTPLVDSVASVINGDDSVVKTTMDEETKAAVAEAVDKASSVETYIEVQVSDAEVDETEMTAIEEKAGVDSTVLACLDIDVVMTIRTDDTFIEDIQLTELASPLYITVTLPEGAPTEPEDSSKILQYYVVLEHEGSYYTIPATLNEDGTISFNSRLFSTYAIVYKMIDKPAPSAPSYGGYVFPKTGVDR